MIYPLVGIAFQFYIRLQSISFCCKSSKRVPYLRRPCFSSGVDHIAEFEAVELARSTNSVGAHVIESEPVSCLQGIGERYRLQNAIEGIACWAPQATGGQWLRRRDMEGPVQRKHVWVHGLMVEQNAVERPVYTFVNIICKVNEKLETAHRRRRHD